MEQVQRLYTLREVAAHFAMALDTVRQWRKDRKLNVVKVLGGSLRVTQTEIDRIVVEGTKP